MVVGNDGVLLETSTRQFQTEGEGLAAEYASCLRASRKAAGNTDMGGLHSSLLVTENGKILFQTLTPDYFLVICLGPKAPASKAFFEISRACKSLEQELMY